MVQKKENFPTSDEVRIFHTRADTDAQVTAIHHTLGRSPTQAAPGNHDHRSLSSVPILEGVTIAGPTGGNVALKSVIAALVELGATDLTT